MKLAHVLSKGFKLFSYLSLFLKITLMNFINIVYENKNNEII